MVIDLNMKKFHLSSQHDSWNMFRIGSSRALFDPGSSTDMKCYLDAQEIEGEKVVLPDFEDRYNEKRCAKCGFSIAAHYSQSPFCLYETNPYKVLKRCPICGRSNPEYFDYYELKFGKSLE